MVAGQTMVVAVFAVADLIGLSDDFRYLSTVPIAPADGNVQAIEVGRLVLVTVTGVALPVLAALLNSVISIASM